MFVGRRALLDGLAQRIDGLAETTTSASLMRLDQMHWLPDDVLVKSDRAGMLVSLETRTPYLQHELAEFAASVKTSTHLGRGGKRLLRELAHELLPDDRGRQRKTAFRVPAEQWLRGPLRGVLADQLTAGRAFEEEWFDRSRVASLVEQHDRGERDWTQMLWPIMAFGLWLDRYRRRDGR
jgi:asparagine synthase (glutamine-hydrolysing)